MALRTLGHVAGSHAEREWHGALGRAFASVSATTYAIADAHTRAPITPFAPIAGRAGIAADVARVWPGLTALPVARVSPEERAEFAAIAERSADVALESVRYSLERAREHADAGREADAELARARAARASDDAEWHAARASAMRATLTPRAA